MQKKIITIFFHNLKIKNKKKSLILSKNQLNNRFQGRKENLTKYLKHKAQYNIIKL